MNNITNILNKQAFLKTKSKRNRISLLKPDRSLNDIRECIISLPRREFKVYQCVIRWVEYSRRHGWAECYPSQTTIGEFTGYCRQSVNEAIGNLVERELIEKVNYYRKTCSYFIPVLHQTKRFKMMLKDIFKPALLSILSLISLCSNKPLKGRCDNNQNKNISIYTSSVLNVTKKKFSKISFDDHCLINLVNKDDFYHPHLQITQAGKIFFAAFNSEVVKEVISQLRYVENIRNINRCVAALCMKVSMEMHCVPTFALMFALRKFHGYKAKNSVPFFVVRKKQHIQKITQVIQSKQPQFIPEIIPTRHTPLTTLDDSLNKCKKHNFMDALLAARKNVLGY